MLIDDIKTELYSLKDENYQKFSSSLLPGVQNVLGVKIPYLRKIAKRISLENWQDYISQNDDEFFELTMIEGMIIGFIGFDFSKIQKFIKKINNWSVCDTFCASIKKIKEHKQETKNFLEKYFLSHKEYELRFAYVILLNYFLDELDYVFKKISQFKSSKYYAQMAAAWALSYCFMKDYDKTLEFIQTQKIDKNVLKKGIKKALDSYRISEEKKRFLKTYKL